ncbi:MAG: glycosyltransferase family 2 protein, partial [Thermodesulfobacteriota bacterium]
YSRHALESVNFYSNSDGFVFDQEIIAQFVRRNLKISEVPVPVRYFPEASSAGLVASTIYGLKILWLLVKYVLHKSGIIKSTRFSNVHGRYTSSPK